MKMKKYLLFTIALLSIVACKDENKADDPIGDNGRTKRTEFLLDNMSSLSQKGYMVGQEDATLYGIGWAGDSCRSDIHTCCGDMPAIIGFDITGIEGNLPYNTDSIYFDAIRNEAINQYDRSGVVTISWRSASVLTSEKAEACCDSICAFLKTLETPYGVRVPVILRPLGQNKAFWQTLSERIEDNEVVNALLMYSPATSCGGDKTKFLAEYPGDDFVDMIGISLYCNVSNAESVDSISMFAKALDKELAMLSAIGKEHSKPYALCETGFPGIKTNDWFTAVLQPVIDKYNICYMMFGRNDNTTPGRFCVPFPGHSAMRDFGHFYNASRTLFLHDVNALYLDLKH